MGPPRGVNANVVRFGGQEVDQFVVAHDRDHAGRRIGQWQGAVIEPGAAAQPDARAIDREGGHQDHRRLCDRIGPQPRLLRFA